MLFFLDIKWEFIYFVGELGKNVVFCEVISVLYDVVVFDFWYKLKDKVVY